MTVLTKAICLLVSIHSRGDEISLPVAHPDPWGWRKSILRISPYRWNWQNSICLLLSMDDVRLAKTKSACCVPGGRSWQSPNPSIWLLLPFVGADRIQSEESILPVAPLDGADKSNLAVALDLYNIINAQPAKLPVAYIVLSMTYIILWGSFIFSTTSHGYVRYHKVYRYHTRGMFGARVELTEVSGTGIIEVVPNLPRCRVPALLRSYPTYRGVGYRYWGCTELTEVSGTGVEPVPRKYPCSRYCGRKHNGIWGIFEWAYRTYRSVGYRYRFCTEPYRSVR